MPASKIAKWKTFVQQLAVGFAIMPPTAVDAKWLWNGLLWISVALALISGSQYVYRAMKSQPTPTPAANPAVAPDATTDFSL